MFSVEEPETGFRSRQTVCLSETNNPGQEWCHFRKPRTQPPRDPTNQVKVKRVGKFRDRGNGKDKRDGTGNSQKIDESVNKSDVDTHPGVCDAPFVVSRYDPDRVTECVH